MIWPLARLRLAGLSKEERSRPVEGWRRWLFHPIVWLLSRAVFFSMGFLWVKVKGRRADLKEAPVLVVAPHSGFLDMLVLCPTQLATVVSRSENTSLPVIGGKGLWLSWHTEDIEYLMRPKHGRKDGSYNQFVSRSFLNNGFVAYLLLYNENYFVWTYITVW